MNATEKGITTLLRSAITGESLPLPDEFHLEDTMKLMRSHGIVTLVYEGAVNCGINRQTPAMQELLQSYCRLMMQSEAQVRILNRMFSRFEELGIDYLPLKGSRLKTLYPKPELRLMGDADILIREEQYGLIQPVMEELGFVFSKETEHEIVWVHKDLHLELHNLLMPYYTENLHRYFQNGWGIAVPHDGCRYALPHKEELVFLLTHFTRHFLGGGIGCRHVLDLWVYGRAVADFQEDQLRQDLEELGLWEFYRNISRLMKAWFEDGPQDEITDCLTTYIFNSGSWGTSRQQIISQGSRKQKISTSVWESRIRYFVQCTFPPRTALLGAYPVLKKHGWLLPLVWIYRLATKLFTGIKLKEHRRAMKLYTQENMDQHRLMLEQVGLKDLH